jgi:regulator of protease activity HflC (stomatin/prohibitin superfamily)
VVNTKMRAILDEATDPWGIKVNRVELKNILPPADIQSSMEKQMKAERDRRQAILQAEGSKKSAILLAEGERESAILRADAEKQAAILRAEAERESAILKAEGEAEAIRAVQSALAESLQMLNEKAPNDQVIKLKSIEAMQKIADGKATKIIIPSEMQGLVGMASGLVEGVKEK